MTSRSRRIGISLATALAASAVLALGIAGSGARAGAGAVSAADDAARPFIVKIHADWCGTCMRLNDTWNELQARLGGRARLVVLDVTDRGTKEQAAAEAARLGIAGFFDDYKSKTGTIGILHGATRQPVSVLKGELSVTKYETAVAAATGADAS